MNTVSNTIARAPGFSIGLAFAGPAAALLILLTVAGTSVVMSMM